MVRTTRIRSIYRIPGGPDAAAEAARIAEQEMQWATAPEVIANATLLLSEITAERSRMGGCLDAEKRITIDVRETPERNRWAVIDRGGPAVPSGLRSTALDEIADAWGISRSAGLTRTWFELASTEAR